MAKKKETEEFRSRFVRQYLDAQIKLAQMRVELLESLREGMEKDSGLTIDDLQIELNAVDSLELLGPRRDIQQASNRD